MSDPLRLDPLDPPSPIPPYLAPIRAALGEGDLRIVATARELTALAGALEALELDPANVMLTHRDGSPWLEIDAVRAPEQQMTMGEALAVIASKGSPLVRLAMWRFTCAVYRIGPDGAVEDEPIYRP